MITKEKRKEYNKRHYLKNREEILKRGRTWKEANKEVILKKHREYNQKNREKINQYYYKNREKCDKKNKEYKKNNLIKVKAYQKNYQKEWKVINPKRIKAYSIANNNIKIPENQLCEIYNINPAQEKHHPDYSKPLEVKFLCIKCHNLIRRKK